METAIHTSNAQEREHVGVRWHWVIPIGLACVAVLLYASSFRFDMMYSWDDNRYLRENQLLRDFSVGGIVNIFTQYYFAAYIPVTIFSYWIEYNLWGLDPAGYHVVNTLLHGANAALVYVFLWRLLGKRWVAVLAALLFAVHPLQVESVAWIAERKNLLAMLFALLAFLAHMSATRDNASPLRQGLTWLLFLLACLSKPTVVGLPVLFVVYDYYWGGLPLSKAIQRNIVPFVIAAVTAYLIIDAHADYGGIKQHRGGSPVNTALLMMIVFWDYVVSLVFPANLNNFYQYPVDMIGAFPLSVALGLALVAGAAVLLWIGWRRRWRFAVFAILWAGLFMAPVSNIIPIAIERADRYIYFPGIVIFAAVGLGLERLWHWRENRLLRYAIFGLSGAAVVGLAAITSQRSQVWLNEGTLWKDHLLDYPYSQTGWLNLGVYYYNIRDFEQAVPTFEHLLSINPGDFKGNRFMGHIALRQERYADAIPYYERAAGVNPRDDITQNYLALSHFRLGNYEQAIAHYRRVIELDDDNTFRDVYSNLGHAAMVTGDNELAVQALTVALDRNPRDARANSDLCTVYVALGRTSDGMAYCQLASQLEPTNGLYVGRYAHLLLETNQLETALPVARQAVEIAPAMSLSHRVLGDALRGLGRDDEAIDAYRRALELDSSNYRARQGLDLLLGN